jgi:hypothetical protein
MHGFLMLPLHLWLARLRFCGRLKRFAVHHMPPKCIYRFIQALRALAELITLEPHEGDYA